MFFSTKIRVKNILGLLFSILLVVFGVTQIFSIIKNPYSGIINWILLIFFVSILLYGIFLFIKLVKNNFNKEKLVNNISDKKSETLFKTIKILAIIGLLLFFGFSIFFSMILLTQFS